MKGGGVDVEKRELAYELYKDSNGEKPLVEIAQEVEASPGTVRGWKSRYKWDELIGKEPTKRNATRNVATQKAIEQIADNDNLTEQQKLFCLHYSQSFNATASYQKAYGCSRATALTNGSRLLGNARIRDEINRIKDARNKDYLVNDNDIINEWLKMAFNDITEYVEFKKVFVDYIRDEKDMPKLDEFGEMIPYYRNELHFKDSNEVDGTLIQEVKKGKDGASVKLYDKQRALIELHKLIGGENTLKLQMIEAQIAKLQKELSVDTSTEDKLANYFEKLGAEIDGAN